MQVDGRAAAVLSVSPEEIQVLTPDNFSAASAQVVVANGNGTSDAVSIEIRSRMSALFLEANGHLTATREDGSRVGPADLITDVESLPARPGDLISIFGTGFGRTDPEVPSMSAIGDALPNLVDAVTVRVHTSAITPEAARLVKPGYYGIQFRLPQLEDGDYAVAVEVAGVRTEKSGRIHIRG